MTELLLRIFIGKNKDAKDMEVRKKMLFMASIVGITVNIILFAGKLTAGLLAVSVAVIADAFNNMSDAGSSLITFIGYKLSSKHVDKEHPLGHGRFEYITGFIVNILIILVGVELLKTSIEKIITPESPNVSLLTIIVLGVSILFKLWLFVFYRKIAKKTDSSAVKASSTDSISDVIATTLVLISAIVFKYFGVLIDGYVGIAVALFIAFTGIKSSKETIDLLLGSTPSKEFVSEIKNFVLSHEEIVGIHDLMVHDYGPGRTFVSFHAEVPSNSDINRAHDCIDKIEREIATKFGCIATIHMDPIETDNEQVNALKEWTMQIVKSVSPDFNIHDFRMTYGGLHYNLIFDMTIPVDSPYSEEEAAKLVKEKMQSERNDVYAVIKAEHPFV